MSEPAAPIYRGGCRCGAVRYVASGHPVNQRICHCRLCQKAIGAAFNARILMRGEAVEIDGPIATSPSSPDLERGYCPSCGTTIFSRRLSTGFVGLTTGSLDDPGLFVPEMHMFTTTMQLWLKLADDLPCHEGAPPV